MTCAEPLDRASFANRGDDKVHGRVYTKLCHFSRPGPELGATLSTALVRIIIKMAELLMNSAIPSEGSMRTSCLVLRNGYCANQMGDQ